MTLEDLQEHGVLLPEEEWGRHRLETTVARAPFLAAFVTAAISLGVAYAGDGGTPTWIGISVFLVALLGITWMCDRAIRRQRRRTRREHRELGGPEGHGGGGGEGGDAGAGKGSDGAPGASPERAEGEA